MQKVALFYTERWWTFFITFSNVNFFSTFTTVLNFSLSNICYTYGVIHNAREVGRSRDFVILCYNEGGGTWEYWRKKRLEGRVYSWASVRWTHKPSMRYGAVILQVSSKYVIQQAVRATYSFRMNNWSRWMRSRTLGPWLQKMVRVGPTMEFRTRLNRGQVIEASPQKIRKSHSIPISTKIRLITATVWPVANEWVHN